MRGPGFGARDGAVTPSFFAIECQCTNCELRGPLSIGKPLRSPLGYSPTCPTHAHEMHALAEHSRFQVCYKGSSAPALLSLLSTSLDCPRSSALAWPAKLSGSSSFSIVPLGTVRSHRHFLLAPLQLFRSQDLRVQVTCVFLSPLSRSARLSASRLRPTTQLPTPPSP